jgi:hypothetical protein
MCVDARVERSASIKRERLKALRAADEAVSTFISYSADG